jgi:hypothetical protein
VASPASTSLPSGSSAVDCTASNISEINAAIPVSKKMLDRARSYIVGPSNKDVDSLLQNYFNDSSAGTYLHVLQGLDTMIDGFAGGFTVECVQPGSFMYTWHCPEDTIAYTRLVWANIHLCGRAFGRSNAALAETLVHESSHKFDSTEDNAYCEGGCPSGLSPSDAWNNADSFSKFAWAVYISLP